MLRHVTSVPCVIIAAVALLPLAVPQQQWLNSWSQGPQPSASQSWTRPENMQQAQPPSQWNQRPDVSVVSYGGPETEDNVFLPPSPCPEMFKYKWYGGEWVGILKVTPPRRRGPEDPIKLKIKSTMSAMLSTKYVGTVELVEDKQLVFMRLVRGENTPIIYRIRFPLRSPLPYLSVVEVNDLVQCSGKGPGSSGVYTMLSLDHTLYPKSFGNNNNNNNVFPTSPPNPKPPPPGIYTETGPTINIRPPPPTTSAPSPGSWQQPTVVDSGQPFLSQGTQVSIKPEEPVVPPNQRPTWSIPRPVLDDKCGIVVDTVALVQRGNSTTAGNWPWLAALFSKTKVSSGLEFRCGGSLVSRTHVITAAHCIKTSNQDALRPSEVVIYLGKYNLQRWGEPESQPRDVATIFMHPGYNSGNFSNDLAVLLLSSPLEITVRVRPICLWDGSSSLDSIVNRLGTVVGWGRDEKNNFITEEPKMVEMPVVSQEVCLRSASSFVYLTTNTMYCAGRRDGSGPCSGDSGGGMYFQSGSPPNTVWKLRGVVSFSLLDKATQSCDNTNYSVFTDLAKFTNWIAEVMRRT